MLTKLCASIDTINVIYSIYGASMLVMTKYQVGASPGYLDLEIKVSCTIDRRKGIGNASRDALSIERVTS